MNAEDRFMSGILRFVSICSDIQYCREMYLKMLVAKNRRAYLKWQTEALIALDRYYC